MFSLHPFIYDSSSHWADRFFGIMLMASIFERMDAASASHWTKWNKKKTMNVYMNYLMWMNNNELGLAFGDEWQPFVTKGHHNVVDIDDVNQICDQNVTIVYKIVTT